MRGQRFVRNQAPLPLKMLACLSKLEAFLSQLYYVYNTFLGTSKDGELGKGFK